MFIMSKIRKYLDLFFKISNFTIIILYLYPGSILGWILYGNLKSQPQLTGDFLSLSSNHYLLYTSPSPRDQRGSRMPSSA